MTDTEEFLSRALAEEARQAPAADGLAAAVRRRRRRRQRVNAAAGALAVAAAVATTVAVVDFGEEQPVDVATGTPQEAIALPDSGWPESGVAAQAAGRGVLAATEDGCFYLDRSPDLPPLGLLWPQGWTWTTAPDGTFEIRNPAGEVVMTPGDHIQIGGGYTPTPTEQRDICGVATGVWFPMNNDPTKAEQ